MKKVTFITAVLTVLITFQTMAQWVGITKNNPTPLKKELISSNIKSSVVHFTLDGFYKQKVQTPQGTQYIISLDGATPLLEKGAPDLPKATASVIIPDLDKMTVKIIDAKYQDIKNIDIAPSKGNLYRDVDPETVPYTYGSAYQKDAFFPNKQVGLRTPHIVRDYRGQTIIAYPFNYNPTTKTLRVYYDMTLEISSTGEQGENVLYRTKAVNKIEQNFAQVYNRHFLNTDDTKYDAVGEEGDILIIAYPDFMDAMQPYIEWKKMTGRKVEMVSLETAGGNASGIKQYIADYYNNPDHNLGFCLLVGDAPQVPSLSAGGGGSDNKYSYIVGNDHYPDIFMGRFSAETVAQVETQVQRTIDYEKTPFTGETEWYSKSISVGSNQGAGSGDDGEADWQHLRNIQTDLNGFTYDYNYEFFDSSHGGNDAPGNPTPGPISEALNSGSTIVNYTGHGSDISWGTSGFSNSDVNNLTNAGKLPFIWSVACVNGNFVNLTCFAEAWLRATDSEGNPTGAVATLMSTINQSWKPPMAGQDEMNDILTEQYDNNIKRTFGALSFNGCMLMNDEYGAGGDDMTDTWTLFGDPSVMVRTAAPTAINASYQPTIFIGSTFHAFTVNDAEGAIVAITLNGELLGKATVTGGTATVNFPTAPTVPGVAKVVITAFNKIPHVADVEIIPAEGPYVLMQSCTISDGNNNLAEFSENVNLTVELKNVGIETANNVNCTLICEDEYVTLTDAEENAGNIAAETTITLNEAFAFSVANNVPDGHVASFTLKSVSGDNEWESAFVITLNAPVFNSSALSFEETSGNGNGSLDPNETGNIKIPFNNIGHADTHAGTAQLTSQSNYVIVNNDTFEFTALPVNDQLISNFPITCESNTPMGHVVQFTLTITSGEYTYTKEYAIKVGLIMEDFEAGNFSAYPWTFSGNQDWVIVNDETYEGQYAAKSGSISNGQTSALILERENPVADSISFYYKVSSEGNYDKLKFYIDNEEKGVWSGDIDWTKAAYAVPAGSHTFKWAYTKDQNQSAGSDCAWLDNITLPASPSKSINAGSDMQECVNTAVTLNGSASLIEAVQWTTSGDGTFDDASALQAVYTPGENDATTGNVTLTLSEVGGNLSDEMMITYLQAPEAEAGEDMSICSGDMLTITGATAANYTQITWTSSGTGTFEDAHALQAVYTPSEQDILAGQPIVLTLTAESAASCPAASDQINLIINTLPEAPANPEGETEVCSGGTNTYAVSEDASAMEYMWMITPAEAGTVTGNTNTVEVAWNAEFTGEAMIKTKAHNDCGDSEYNEGITVNVKGMPMASFTSDITMVDVNTIENTEFMVTDASNYNTMMWSIEPAEAVTEIQNGDTEKATFVWNKQFAGATQAKVMCTLTNDCGETVVEHTFEIKNSDGIAELGLNSAAIYPNPNNGTFKIKLNSEKEQAVNIRIVDMTGKVIFHQENVIIENTYSKDMQIEGANGLYYLMIENNKGNFVKKIVVQ